MTFYLSLIFIIWKLISGGHVSTPLFIMFIIGSIFRILNLRYTLKLWTKHGVDVYYKFPI